MSTVFVMYGGKSIHLTPFSHGNKKLVIGKCWFQNDRLL